MYCNKCGKLLTATTQFCPNCGQMINHMANQAIQPNINNVSQTNNLNQKVTNSKINKPIIIGLSVFTFILFLIVVIIKSTNNYYFKDITKNNENIDNKNTEQNIYRTSVDSTKFISDFKPTEEEFKKEIINISKKQKAKCNNDKILEEEIKLETQYYLYAANLCELDIDYIKNINIIFSNMETEYPELKTMLSSNQSLTNPTEDFIAAYGIINVYEDDEGANLGVGMILNSKYYLDLQYFKMAIDQSTKAGHFPKNTNIYSPIAHELGHKLHYYISFKKAGFNNTVSVVSSSDYSKLSTVMNDIKTNETTDDIVSKATNNLYGYLTRSEQKEKTNLISGYAGTSNAEAIAESVHDYYLNKENAHPLSIEIVKVLKQELGKY